MQRLSVIGVGMFLVLGACSTLPPKSGYPDLIEVRFKASQDSIIETFKNVLYENGYAVATFSPDEGIIETDWKPLKKGVSCCVYVFDGVKEAKMKVTAYVGRVEGDTLNYIKVQGVLKILGPRPWDNEYQIRPVKKGSPYYKELEKLVLALESKLGEKGKYESFKRNVLLK
ncbi:MAG: hypothetical protein GXO29_06950 [Thermotogae bacterium]|nr:hypothetical protein [Thermotogota bacterium]